MGNFDSQAFDFNDLYMLLKRRFRTAFLCFVLIFGAALVYVSSISPTYTATVLILVHPTRSVILPLKDQPRISARSENARVQNEVEILASDSVALATIHALNLTQDPEFGPEIRLSEKLATVAGVRVARAATSSLQTNTALEKFSKAITIRRRGITQIVSVSVASQNAQRSAKFANALVKTYISMQIQAKTNASLAAKEVLQGQIDRAQSALGNSELALNQFFTRDQNSTVASHGAGVDRYRKQALFSDGAGQATAKEYERAQLSLILQDWEKLVETLRPEPLLALAVRRGHLIVGLDEVVKGSAKEADLLSQIRELERGFQQQFKIAIEALIDTAKLREVTSDVVPSANRPSRDINQLSATELANLFRLQQNSIIAQRQYALLLTRLQDIETQAVTHFADARIISPALAPSKPEDPTRFLILGFAIMGGVALGVGGALAEDFYFGGVVSQQQLEFVLPVKVGGVIPKVAADPIQPSVASQICETPLAIYAEAFRGLRAVIDQTVAADDDQGTIVAITSSIPAEGKTAVALALARTYGLSGKKILLIDADMRKPGLHEALYANMRNAGLQTYLTEPKVKKFDFKTVHVDLKTSVHAILGDGHSTVATDQLLNASKFEALLKQAQREYDLVIIDTPPLIPIVDARYVCKLADIVLFVVGANGVRPNELRTTHEKLTDFLAPTTKLLSILNRTLPVGSQYHSSV